MFQRIIDMFHKIKSLFSKPEPQKLRHVEKIYERYGDFQEVGVWGTAISNEGVIEPVVEDDIGDNFLGTEPLSGKMYVETIKVLYDDGTFGLETDWIIDTDPRIKKHFSKE